MALIPALSPAENVAASAVRGDEDSDGFEVGARNSSSSMGKSVPSSQKKIAR